MDMTDRITAVPDLPELAFEDSTHTYRLDGEIIPSVSRIMEPLKEATYSGISEKTLRNAANKGSSVHNSIENYFKFQIEDVAPEHRAYFDAFLAWLSEAQPIVVVGSEVRIYHKILRYGGTIDLIYYDKDGLLTLADFKTTYTISDMSCGVQLESYDQALASHGIKVQKKKIIHLKRNGKFKVIDYPVGDTVRWRVFGALKCLYDYVQSYKK